MRVFSVFLLVVVAAIVTVVNAGPVKTYNLDDAPKLFEQYVKDYEREYKNEADRESHYKSFVEYLKYINEESAKGREVPIGIFADITPEDLDLTPEDLAHFAPK